MVKLTARQIIAIADEHALPRAQVMEAVKDLGHADGKKIAGYLLERSLAVSLRQKGMDRNMNADERRAYFIKKYS